MAKQIQPELEPERDGIGEGVAETQQPNDPIAEGANARQPEKVQADDLTADPRFRKWQAEQDKKLAKLRQEVEQREQQYQRQLEQERQALRQKQLEGMDDYERAKYEREEAIREAAYWREQAAMIQTQTARERELSGIAQKFGVPREVLEEATSRAEALEMAWDYKQQNEQEQRQRTERDSEERRTEREQKRTANKVDVGAGIGSTPKSDFEREYEAALKSGNSAKLARFLLPRG